MKKVRIKWSHETIMEITDEMVEGELDDITALNAANDLFYDRRGWREEPDNVTMEVL